MRKFRVGKHLLALIMASVLMLYPLTVSALTVEWVDDNGNVVGTTELNYTDIDPNAFYIEYIAALQDAGIMKGTSETTFSPSLSLSRAHFVTMLWRLADEPDDIEYQNGTFQDVEGVPANAWYTTAVAWANEYGIMTGYDEGNFGPSDYMTREQVVTVLYRFAVLLGADNGARDNLGRFPDKASVSRFAQEPMQWAVANGLISGDQGYLKPQGDTERGQAAKIIVQFILALGIEE